jgi:hypothetical protein
VVSKYVCFLKIKPWLFLTQVHLLLFLGVKKISHTTILLIEFFKMWRHVASRHSWHIILIPRQPVFVVTPDSCVLRWEAANTDLIVFGLIWLGREPTIYYTQGEHANHWCSQTIFYILLHYEKTTSTFWKILSDIVISVNVTCSHHDIAENLFIWD